MGIMRFYDGTQRGFASHKSELPEPLVTSGVKKDVGPPFWIKLFLAALIIFFAPQ